MQFSFLYCHSQWFLFVDSNSSLSATIYHQIHVHMNFFLTMTDTNAPQNVDLSFRITLCNLQLSNR